MVEFADPVGYLAYLAPALLAYVLTSTSVGSGVDFGLVLFLLAGIILFNVLTKFPIGRGVVWKTIAWDILIYGLWLPFMAVSLFLDLASLDWLPAVSLFLFTSAAIFMASFLRLVYEKKIKDIKKGFFLLLGIIHLFVIVYGIWFWLGVFDATVFLLAALLGMLHLVNYFLLFKKSIKQRKKIVFILYGAIQSLLPIILLAVYLLH